LGTVIGENGARELAQKAGFSSFEKLKRVKKGVKKGRSFFFWQGITCSRIGVRWRFGRGAQRIGHPVRFMLETLLPVAGFGRKPD